MLIRNFGYRKEIKLERKLDSKLEKMESKAMKLKKKSEGANPTGKNAFRLPIAAKTLFDGATAGQQCSNTTVPHMSGGETYEQQWEVINTGKVSWTSKVRDSSLI